MYIRLFHAIFWSEIWNMNMEFRTLPCEGNSGMLSTVTVQYLNDLYAFTWLHTTLGWNTEYFWNIGMETFLNEYNSKMTRQGDNKTSSSSSLKD
jgi:hypothetical protein